MVLFLIILSITGVLAAWPQPTRKSIAYPSWFWVMPCDSVSTFAVGYARRYARIDTSFAYARGQSVWQLVRSWEMSVVASQQLLNQFGQSRLIGLSQSERIDSTLAPTIASGFSIIDSAVVGDMVLALAAFPSRVSISSSQNRRIPPPARPRWVEILPEEKSAIYTLGTSPLYYYEHHSWERAEANARHQLAFTIATRIRSVTRQAQNVLETWSESQSSVVLRNAAIVSRWLDLAARQCYVLCRMPLQ